MDKTQQKMMDVLKYVSDFTTENGYPPSVREICAAFEIKSTATVYSYLDRLEQEGYIRKSPAKNRAIEVIRGPYSLSARRDLAQIPLLDGPAAGQPLETPETTREIYVFSKGLFEGKDLFLLDVRGDSMSDAGIFEGDKLVVRRQASAENGAIVVALIEGEVAVRRFYRAQDHFILRPENARYSDIVCKEVRILGVAAGLIRTKL